MAEGAPLPARWTAAASVFTVAALAALLGSRAMDLPLSGIPLKMAASTGFVAAAWLAGAFATPYGRAIFAGLCFSWFGDLFLALPGMFLAGLVAFLLGHVCYAIAFVLHGVRPAPMVAAVVLLLTPMYLLFAWLNPHLGDMRYPVYAYMLVITTMLVLSVGAWRSHGTALMFIAALMFWLSDICVARQRFVVESPLNPALGLPVYFGGQLVFAWSIYRLRQIRGN